MVCGHDHKQRYEELDGDTQDDNPEMRVNINAFIIAAHAWGSRKKTVAKKKKKKQGGRTSDLNRPNTKAKKILKGNYMGKKGPKGGKKTLWENGGKRAGPANTPTRAGLREM